jgi:hypothetical protein
MHNQDLDALNELLLKLYEEACQHSPRSCQRRRILNRMTVLIIESKRLWYERCDVYEDALQDSLSFFCRNLCEPDTGKAYDPSRATIITWINVYLQWRIHRLRGIQTTRLKKTASPWQGDHGEMIDPLDLVPSPEPTPSRLDDILRWVETDPTGLLRSTCLRKRPDVTCQLLLLRRLTSETSWQEIANEVNTNFPERPKVVIPTLSSFFMRNCIPMTRKFLNDQGLI